VSDSQSKRYGVLAMAYGTPLDLDDIERYYTDIRRGRPPTQEQLADLVARYDAIGGTFPLRAITDQQIAAIQSELGAQYLVTLGTRHSSPSIEDGLSALFDAGIRQVVGLVLAPHYSAMSIGAYSARAAKAAADVGVTVDTIESWHLLPAYLDFLAAAVRAARATVPSTARIVFTAHSLPARILDTGDPYPEQLRETAEAVALRAGLTDWSIGWQSAGRTEEPWLGPDVLDLIRSDAATNTSDRTDTNRRGLVVCACGFVADHLEVAYDLDIEARQLAAELAVPFARTASVNSDPTVMRALAALIRERFSKS
jgi:ferrochelatase